MSSVVFDLYCYDNIPMWNSMSEVSRYDFLLSNTYILAVKFVQICLMMMLFYARSLSLIISLLSYALSVAMTFLLIVTYFVRQSVAATTQS